MEETYDLGVAASLLEIVEVSFTFSDRDGAKEPSEIISQRPRDEMTAECILLNVVHQILDLLCVWFLALCKWRNKAQGCNCVKQILVEKFCFLE
jgi:hypothetical protein